MTVAGVALGVATAGTMPVAGAVRADDEAGAEEEAAEMTGERKGALAEREGVPAGAARVLAEDGAPVGAKAPAKRVGTVTLQSQLLLMLCL